MKRVMPYQACVRNMKSEEMEFLQRFTDAEAQAIVNKSIVGKFG